VIARRTARVALAAILLLAVFLRLSFFVGLVAGDPQDDGIYYGNAYAIYDGGGQNLDRYRGLPADWLPNPIDQFPFRSMVIYPIAGAFSLFGPGEHSAALWGLLCSLVTIVIVYQLGTLLHDRATGLTAAFLCAFYPIEVINGTRILSDVQVGMFTALALLLIVQGERRRSAVMYALSGVVVACAYLANARGLIVLAMLVSCTVLQWLITRPRPLWYAPILVMAGFAGVFASEAAINYFRIGEPLMTLRVQTGAAAFKYLHEPVTNIDWGWLLVSYTNGEPFDLTRGLLGLTTRPDQFGLFFILFFAAIVFSIVTRRNLLLLAFAIGMALYLEFGPVRVSIDWSARQLHYMMVFKQDRFLMVLTAPLLILSACLLRAGAKRSRLATLALVLLLAASSLEAIGDSHRFYRAGLRDLRGIAQFVQSNADIPFYGDHWAVEQLRIFTRHRVQNLRTLNPSTKPEELRGACVTFGGSRGVELLASYVESTLPPFAREILDGKAPPAEWKLIAHVAGSTSAQRLHDLWVYCVP
jgi:Dolichyl-phosphate-mannose-protein mannosyltransferase